MLTIGIKRELGGKEIFRLATADGYIPMFNQQPPTLEEIFKQKVGEANV